MPVTIKDIARSLGLTHATVSKALNGHPAVSEETRARVLKLARELNYRPNLVARSLSKRRSHTVGVAWHGLGESWHSYLAGEIHNVFTARGFEVIFSLDHPAKAAILFAQQMLDWVIVGHRPGQKAREELLEWHGHTGIPLISVGFVLDRAVSSVDADRAAAIALGVKHLCSLGRRRIAFISHQPEKIEGYRRGLAENNLVCPPSYLREEPREDWRQALDILLGLHEQPDAILAGDSLAALRVLHELRVRGYDVPGRIAVVGYDEIPGCDEAEVPLTTVGPSARLMAEAVADALLTHPREEMPVVHLQIPPRLVIRRSCGAGQAIQGSVRTR